MKRKKRLLKDETSALCYCTVTCVLCLQASLSSGGVLRAECTGSDSGLTTSGSLEPQRPTAVLSRHWDEGLLLLFSMVDFVFCVLIIYYWRKNASFKVKKLGLLEYPHKMAPGFRERNPRDQSGSRLPP